MGDIAKPNIILSFDTTGLQDSIAVSGDGHLAVKLLPQGGSGLQSAILIPELVDLLATQGWRLSDVTTVCVLSGPGSFTGIRLGLATAGGLHFATGCRIFAPTLLDVLLFESPGSAAVVDSKRGDYFVKIQDSVSILTAAQVQILAHTSTIISTQAIPGVQTIVSQLSMAQQLISFCLAEVDHTRFGMLEPFYIRTPEFAKKKSFMSESDV